MKKKQALQPTESDYRAFLESIKTTTQDIFYLLEHYSFTDAVEKPYGTYDHLKAIDSLLYNVWQVLDKNTKLKEDE